MKDNTKFTLIWCNIILFFIMFIAEIKYSWLEIFLDSSNGILVAIGFGLGFYMFPLGGVWLWIVIGLMTSMEETKEEMTRRVIKEELSSQNASLEDLE